MTERSLALARWARIAIVAASVWLLIWSLMKLFAGNPQDLPASVRDRSPFGPQLTFQLVIAIELTIFSLALLRPRVGWIPLAGLYALFLAILVPLVASGAESCGCGGGAVKMPPLLMLSIDGALLLALLATRPWQTLASPRIPIAYLAALLLAAWGAPWIVLGSTSDVEAPIVFGPDGTVRTVSGEIRYALLDPPRWVGKPVYEVPELTRWIPEEKLPIEGSIVLWRQSCPHCAAHLRALAGKDDGSRQFLLVQARDDLKNAREVDAMPQGEHVQTFAFPENLECAFTTPCEIVVEGGVVKAALYEKDFHPEGTAEVPQAGSPGGSGG